MKKLFLTLPLIVLLSSSCDAIENFPSIDTQPAPYSFGKVLDCPAILGSQQALGHIACALDYTPCSRYDGPEDMLYLALPEKDIEDMLKFIKKRQEGTPYIAEANDCDDMAREFLHYARVWGRRNYPKIPASVLIGKAYMKIDGDYRDFSPKSNGKTKGWHVMNFVCSNTGQVYFVEPQNMIRKPVEPYLWEGVIEVFKGQF